MTAPIMNLQSRFDKWSSQLSDVFQAGSGGNSSPADNDWRALLTGYQQEQIKLTKSWWTVSTYDKYIENNIIPRGLRIKILPTFETHDENFKAKWEDVLHKCSMQLLKLACEHEKGLVSELTSKINDIERRLSEFSHNELYITRMSRINSEIDRVAQEIIDRKRQKYIRDTTDYTIGTIYKWGKGGVSRNTSNSEMSRSERSGDETATRTGQTQSADPFLGVGNRRESGEGGRELRDREKWAYRRQNNWERGQYRKRRNQRY